MQFDDSKSPLRRMRGNMPPLTFYKLKKYCETHAVDIHHIDSRLTYGENIEHLESVRYGGDAPELIECNIPTKHHFADPERVTKMQATEEQRQYLDDMADQMGLIVHAKAYVKKLEAARIKLERYESLKVRLPKAPRMPRMSVRMPKPPVIPSMSIIGGRKHGRKSSIGGRIRLPDPAKILKQKTPRKRQRLHTTRTSKVPRVLRKPIKNGHRVFSFSDDIWKVRTHKRRRK